MISDERVLTVGQHPLIVNRNMTTSKDGRVLIKNEQKTQLFRSQVIDSGRHRLVGEVVLLQPLSTSVLTGLGALTILILVVFLIFGSYTRSERVRGALVPDRGLIKLYGARGGAVDSINIGSGDVVSEGQVLLTIAADHVQQDGGQAELRQQALLDIQSNELERQIVATQIGSELETRRLTDHKSALLRQAAALRERLRHQNRRHEISEEMLSSLRHLVAQGHATTTELRRREEAMLDQAQAAAGLRQQVAVTEAEIGGADAALARLPVQTTDRISALRTQLAEVAQKRNEAETRRASALRAPVSGQVVSIQAALGQQVAPNLPLVTLIPNNTVLEAEIYVPARAAGFLRPGLEVRLAYDAFPFEHFGTHRGRVRRVDSTALGPGEIAATTQVAEPVYRVTAEIERQSMDAFGQASPLRPGMALTADIFLETRQLYQWLFRPLIASNRSGAPK